MNPLKVLHLSSGSTLEDAKKNYRILSLKFHPDKNPIDPLASSKFMEINEAIRCIENNPKILGQIKQKQIKGFIQTQIDVTTEDIYFYKDLNVTIERTISCEACNGTGCEDGKNHDCKMCDGLGNINSSILKMMNKSSVCPTCNGTGIHTENLCKKCFGTKKDSEYVNYKFKVTLKDYERNLIILRGMGNEIDKGTYSDIHVRLNYIEDKNIKIEDLAPLGKCFVTYIPVRPIQKIIGDEITVDVFGCRMKVTIFPGEFSYVAQDKRPPYRAIHCKYIQQFPIITPETRELYEKIREIERFQS